MASIELVLRYGGHEARTEIPLKVDIPEVLRRVGLKRGGRPHEETANQVADEIRASIEDHRLICQMLREIVDKLDT